MILRHDFEDVDGLVATLRVELCHNEYRYLVSADSNRAFRFRTFILVLSGNFSGKSGVELFPGNTRKTNGAFGLGTLLSRSEAARGPEKTSTTG